MYSRTYSCWMRLCSMRVVDHPAHEGDVGARAQLGPHVGDRARAIEARVDVQDVGAALLGAGQPVHRDGVILGRVAAHDQDDVGVHHVDPVVGHGAPAEGGRQTGDRGAVSETGLVLDVDEAEGAHELGQEVALLVVERRAAQAGDGLGAVDHVPVHRPS